MVVQAGIERNQARPSQYSERLGGPGGEVDIEKAVQPSVTLAVQAAYFND